MNYVFQIDFCYKMSDNHFSRGIFMTRHVIVWKIEPEYTEEQKNKIKADAKRELENLMGQIPGLQKIKISTKGLKSSNGDMMLDSLFDTEAALNAYTIHPTHVHVATTFVRPFMETRLCFDFEE